MTPDTRDFAAAVHDALERLGWSHDTLMAEIKPQDTGMKTETLIYDPCAGETALEAILASLGMAIKHNRPVRFEFNGHWFTTSPGDSLGNAKERFHSETGIEALTRDQMAERAKRDLERMEAEQSAAIATAKAPTEQEMRETKVPSPKSMDELTAYINTLVDRPHDYGTCVYAMSMAATAAMNYVGAALGVTGFQASCADIDILRRSRGMEGPFGVVKAEDMLYPQYDLQAELNKWLDEWRPWAAEQARKKLNEVGEHAHPNVAAHWRKLAGETTDAT